MKTKGNAAIGVAWYRKEQWGDLLGVSEDRDKLEATYGEWLIEANLALRRMRQSGMDIRKVDVDVEELVRWCREQGRPVNAASRAYYVAERVKGEY